MIKVIPKKANFILTTYGPNDTKAWYLDVAQTYIFLSFLENCDDKNLKIFLTGIIGSNVQINDYVISSLRKAEKEKIQIVWNEEQ